MCANESETKEKQKLTQIKNELQHIQDINILASQKSSNSWKIVKLTSLNNIVSFVHLRVFLSYFFVNSLVRLYEISDTPDPERTASVLDLLLRSSIHWLLVAEEKKKTRFYGNINGGEPTKKYLQLWLYFDDQINVVELF